MGDTIKEIQENLEKIKAAAPELVQSFNSLFLQTTKEGSLSTKHKELIALGIALAQRCEPCIRMHVHKSLAAGCTREEIIEAAQVAVMMQGGPAYLYFSVVLDALSA